jgi:hypothetical protein
LGVVAGFSGGGQRLKMGRLVAVPVLFGCRLVCASLVVKASLLGGFIVVMVELPATIWCRVGVVVTVGVEVVKWR